LGRFVGEDREKGEGVDERGRRDGGKAFSTGQFRLLNE
jgi:hypothetical protein